ncbi:MAG: nucleotidyltransferase [Bacteroidetes bacterium GWF2_38_335]|nr:MAG: nucleotidyltransferase [Bacteroidetes bacterium GWF2_38_335]OFY78174.1 MAG: nucleotidyltransferase [Bacteroidetes bacterium RIFOXYA12_FULL_38_20]HBS88664.1 nucleotidyltransferase [Bacteroidales bacterium]
MDLINRNKDKLEKLCEKHKVNELYVFGSILTDEFNELSDIDFLIQFLHVDLPEYFDNYMDLKEKLEALFNRPVDLVEDQAIRNPVFRKVVDRNKILIYGRKSA